jgi:hypothetical protein
LTPSPVIATTSPLACSALTRRSFCSGVDAREDVDLLGYPAQLLVVESRQFDAGERRLAFLGNIELAGDRQGGDGVIAGDHLDRDAGGVTGVHGGDGFRARRVDHADQADELQAGVGTVLVEGQRVRRGVGQAGDGQNAQALLGHGARGVLDLLVAQSHRLAGGVEHLLRARQQLFESALEVRQALAFDFVRRGHVLTRRVERDFVAAREALVQRRLVETGLAGDDQQRALGRVADDRPLFAVFAQVLAFAAGISLLSAASLHSTPASRHSRKAPAISPPSPTLPSGA